VCAALLASTFSATAHAQTPSTESAGKAADTMVEYAKLAVPYLLTAIGALVIFIIGRMVASWVGRLVHKALTARDFDKGLTRFLSKLARNLMMLGVVLGILGMFGIETTSFAAVIGAAGLAIGLAFQGTLSNFSAGVLILTFKPFEVGDLVEAAGETGKVEEVGLFTVTLLTLDNKKIIVPNSGVTGNNITNITAMDTRRVDVNVGTEYSADLDQTRDVLEKVVAEVKGSLEEPAPQVFLAELGDSCIAWQLRVWCKTENYWDVWQRLTRDAKVALDDAEIGIPFPQMDVHMDKAS
jgi:small conductance mechanosensitive channel